MTEDTAPEDKPNTTRDVLVVVLLILVLIGTFLAYDWLDKKGDGSFAHSFEACDQAGRCATVKVFAPGYAYRWAYGRDQMEAMEDGMPQLAAVVNEHLRGAQGVVATGLASHEGSDAANRRLSSCRSKRLAQMLEDAQAVANTQAQIYRVALGRYEEGGAPVLESDDSAIERLVVMAFILDQDPQINLTQAMRVGLREQLPPALREALRPIQRQLDFRNYACWRTEFGVTPNAVLRQTCYREPSRSATAFCSDF